MSRFRFRERLHLGPALDADRRRRDLPPTGAEKAEMARFAAAFRKTLSEYLIALHRVTVTVQSGRPRPRKARPGSPGAN